MAIPPARVAVLFERLRSAVADDTVADTEIDGGGVPSGTLLT
jgi:hypothetical protein